MAEGADRIDRFVAAELGISRTLAARLVAEGAVLVNGSAVRRSYRPLPRDLIEAQLPEREAARDLVPLHLPLDVVYEDEHFLVINKPAGLVVHPAPGHWDDTLLNALLAHGIRPGGGATMRPGIVHRLDKDTSGLMLVAKSDASHERLSRAIAARDVRREYAALCWGHFDGDVVLDAPIARQQVDRKRMGVSPAGRRAVTHVHPVARFDVADLVRLRLETGRTHQIRVHLAWAGRPVVGDPAYGGGGARRISGRGQGAAQKVERATPRQALHAARLAFRHPETGAPMEFRSEWPDDLRAALVAVSHDETLLAHPNPLLYLGFFRDDG